MTRDQFAANALKSRRAGDFLIEVYSMLTEGPVAPDKLAFAAKLVAMCATLTEEVSEQLDGATVPAAHASIENVVSLSA